MLSIRLLLCKELQFSLFVATSKAQLAVSICKRSLRSERLQMHMNTTRYASLLTRMSASLKLLLQCFVYCEYDGTARC